MLKKLLTFIFVLTLINCGSTTTLSSADLSGYYILTGFDFTFETGANLSESEVSNWEGYIFLTEDGTYSIYQKINSTGSYDKGTYTITAVDTIEFDSDYSDCLQVVKINFNGIDLETTYDSTSCGGLGVNQSYWEKAATEDQINQQIQ